MGFKRLLMLTSAIYFMNGSLDAVISDKYSSAKAAVSPYIIDYLINKDKPDYKPNIEFEWNLEKDNR